MIKLVKNVSLFLALLTFPFLFLCTHNYGKNVKKNHSLKNSSTIGVGSWYGGNFHGKKTASGKRFNMYNYTAAHRSLPLGTQVRVVNLKNGRGVIVKINDRGPYIKGRIIDLSYAAAKSIGMVGSGIARVKVEVISVPAG
ncbi:MAG: septal ring lytic transglycosylase RlpA family protein [Thermodesulfobacteriota bacterium]